MPRVTHFGRAGVGPRSSGRSPSRGRMRRPGPTVYRERRWPGHAAPLTVGGDRGEEIGIVKVLTEEQRRRFEEDGCVVVENALDPALDIAPVMAEYSRVLDRIAETLVAEGAIRSTYA